MAVKAMTESLRAPFPYFGGKRKVAEVVWQRFGDIPNYVEPFFGSGAVLLARPSSHTGYTETVNDKDGYVSNFWRGIKSDPNAVAEHADWPVNENDLHARHAWLVGQRDSLVAKLEGDPDYYDAKIAGWWCWGMCCWIGSGFCSGDGPWGVMDGKLVHLGGAGQGINRQLVRLGNAGQGINRKLVHLGGGQGGWFAALAKRLRHVRVCSGDWSRACTPAVTRGHGLTGVFLDPPYDQEGRAAVYYHEDAVSEQVRLWAIEHGNDPLMRIALCGYKGEHAMPEGWTIYEWKSSKGYGNSDGRGRENSYRERIWFSPHCLPEEQRRLL